MKSNEAWWNISGYSGKYQVSSYGRIRSFAGNGKKKSVSGKILNTSLSDRGYVRVTLRNGGQVKYAKVHRLVAEAFLDNPYGYTEINHIDGDKTNNCADNLEWCSRSENLLHAYRIGLKPSVRPGGRVVCLEITLPDTPVFGELFRGYFFGVVPRVGRIISGHGQAYSYLPASALAFPRPPALRAIMESVGLREVGYRLAMLGTVAIHWGTK